MNIQKKKKKNKELVIVLLVLGALLIGIGVSLVANQQSTDNRGRATSQTGTKMITFGAANGTQFTSGSRASISVAVTGTTSHDIAGLNFAASLTGTVPTDLMFQSATIQGLGLAQNEIQDRNGVRTLVVGYLAQGLLTTPQTPYRLTGDILQLGTIEFTVPQSGQITFTFDQTESKILQIDLSQGSGSDVDVLRPINTVSYQFAGQPTSMATQIPRPTNTPTRSPTATLVPTTRPTNTPTSMATATPTRMPTATLVPTIRPTSTPMGMPTATVNPYSTATPTLRPTATIRPTATSVPTTYPSPTQVAYLSPTPWPTEQMYPTPTPTTPTGIPNPPSWWNLLPEGLRNFLEIIYVWVFYFGRTSSFRYLLDGIF